MSGVGGVWRRWLSWVCGSGTDLVGEEMFALEMRKLRFALDRVAVDPGRYGTFVVPEEFVWPA